MKATQPAYTEPTSHFPLQTHYEFSTTMSISDSPPSSPSLFGVTTDTPEMSSHPIVASYIPSGVHDNVLPMGKYYPSNYENRSGSRSTPQRTSVASSSTLPSSSGKMEPPAHKHRIPTHTRSESDAKRRLQQYQRDMIAQATLAASQVLGRGDKSMSSKLATSLSRHGAPVKNVQLGGLLARGVKPISPRLLPLGSPGPVTPMDLEAGDGYLSRGGAMMAPCSDYLTEEVARAVRVDEERRRREGSSPPVLSPV
jgi:hypothetical protein